MRDLSAGTPLGALVMELRRRFARARASEDLGASTIEWVIITAILVGLAAVVGFLIYNLVQGRAEQIEIPDLPGGP